MSGVGNRHRRERDKARVWWEALVPHERFQLGDDFVLGSFDWRDWGFARPPSGAFLSHVDYLRMLWESEA